jgi:DNA-binding transcriptional regulator LsrR (DeoR family)
MSDPRELLDRELLARVARRYYLDDASKVTIAEELGISRFKVARLLEKARETGVVTITVNSPTPIDWELSRRLSNHWGLPALVVNSNGGTEQEVHRYVGEATAGLLVSLLEEGEILGLAWGRTLTAMADFLPRLPKISVVQLTGSVTADLNDSPVELVRRTSLSTGGRAFPIIAPLVVGDTAALEVLKRHPDVKAAIELFDHITTAVIAGGSGEPPASQLRAVIPVADRARLQAAGVRSEINGIFINDEGGAVGKEYTDRYLSISLDQMLHVPRVIAAAGGESKLLSLRAVVLSGIVTNVVTDHTLAREALLLPGIQPGANQYRKQP